MDELEPHTAFAKLADQTRVEILTAVAAAGREGSDLDDVAMLSFSDIYDRVDVSNSSRFAYHLEQLTGTFLRKTDEGYTFTYAGERVVRTVLSGAYGEPATFDPIGVDGVCPACRERRLRARPEAVTFRVRCEACGQGIASYPLTPGLVAERESEAIVEAVAERLRAEAIHTIEGNCMDCGGQVEGEVREVGIVPGDPYLYVGECAQCWSQYTIPVSSRVVDHPATIAFYWDRGVDRRRVPMWEQVEWLVDGRWTVAGPDDSPETYRITIREAGDELRFDLTDDLEVANVTRVTIEGA